MTTKEMTTHRGHAATETALRRRRLVAAAMSVLFALVVSCMVASCARMGQPDGGWFDDTPPRVVSSFPEDMATGVSQRRIVINFNEYIKLEDAQNKVIISPPQIEMADIKASGRRIIVELKDSLRDSTTYTVDFSDAISDNNENNPMGNYTFSFSTGDHIDTLEVAGYALDAQNLEPIKGMLVGLYSNLSDTIFRSEPMIRVSRTDSHGHFVIKGVAPGSYRIYGLQDADGDFVFNQKSEMIGFSHDTIVPSWKPDVRQDTIWRDSLRIDNIEQIHYTHFLPDDVTLLCFTETMTDRYMLKTQREEPECITMIFSYGHDQLPVINGLNFQSDSAFVVEASEKNDTILYWLRDTALVNQDTLRMELQYYVTDTLGQLALVTDTIEALPKVGYEKRMKELERQREKWEKEQERKKKRGENYDSIQPPTPLRLEISANSNISPLERIYIAVPLPLEKLDTAGLHLYSEIDSIWYEAPHRLRQLSTRVYELQGQWRPGIEYSLEIDSASWVDIYGHVNKPVKEAFKVQTEDDFSTLSVTLEGVADTAQVVVELLSQQDEAVRRCVAVGGVADFFYLKQGKYYLRAFVDLNRNGIWDTGLYDADLQAEPVYYNREEIECKQKWDVSRTWNLTSTPRYRQKPLAITKQKGEKEKQRKNRNAERAQKLGIEYNGQ